MHRLTKSQFQNSLAALLGNVTIGELDGDSYIGGFATVGAGSVVTSASGVQSYQVVIDAALDQVFADTARRNTLIGCTPKTGVLFTMKCFAEFLAKLQSIPEGAGTLLDNSLVYATSCTAWGKVHTTSEWPVLLAGKGGGQFAGNQHFRKPNGNLSQVLMTVGNAMGANLKEIGLDSGHVTAELSGLRIGT